MGTFLLIIHTLMKHRNVRNAEKQKVLLARIVLHELLAQMIAENGDIKLAVSLLCLTAWLIRFVPERFTQGSPDWIERYKH
jgi:hypothetical protein